MHYWQKQSHQDQSPHVKASNPGWQRQWNPGDVHKQGIQQNSNSKGKHKNVISPERKKQQKLRLNI